MSKTPSLKNLLCYRLYVVSNRITRLYRPFLEKLNLTYPQYLTMVALWEEDDLTIGELHSITEIDCGSLSVMLKKLVEKGFIEIVTQQSDKRSKKVKLTKKALALKPEAYEMQKNLYASLPKKLTYDEQAELMGLLDILNRNLKGDF